jgi:hypothetical protein
VKKLQVRHKALWLRGEQRRDNFFTNSVVVSATANLRYACSRVIRSTPRRSI